MDTLDMAGGDDDVTARDLDTLESAGGDLATLSREPSDVETAADDDHMMTRDGIRCAGAHIIVDVYGGSRLDDLAHVERTLVECVEAAGATLLHIHLHHFDENSGISGVAVLAESHISVHSWPEHAYAAFDVFMCGDTAPERCVDVIREAFAPERIAVSEILRGKRL